MADNQNLNISKEELYNAYQQYVEAYEDLKIKLDEKNNQLDDVNSKYNELKEINKNLEEKNKKLSEKNDKLDDSEENNIFLIEKQVNFEFISNRKEKFLEDKENEINYLKNQMKDMENEKNKIIEDLKNELNEKEKNINASQNEFNSMKNEVENTHSKFNGAIQQFEKMQNEIQSQKEKIKTLENTEKELKKTLQEYELIKNKNEELDNLLKEGETKEEYLVKPAEDFYDVIIDINSIYSLRNEGWEIKYNKITKEKYQKIIGEQTIKIGVIGINNVGKSYLLSKIIQGEIPTGYSIETKGISIKYSQGEKGEEEGICILDSAGFETPLLNENKSNENNETEKEEIEKEEENKDKLENIIKLDEIEDELSRDKAQTERFIEQLIISLSDMIILVVGKLTRTEQRLITRIKNLSKKNEKNKIKSIIIVHNLSQFHRKIEVENHIKNYLLLSATFKLLNKKVFGIQKYKDRTYYIEKLDEQEDIEVFHYIMAKEGTEAGNYYNDLTIELIKQQYNQFNKRRRINIPQQITKLFSELSTEIIGEKMECEPLENDENKIILKDKKNDEKKNVEKFTIQNTYIDQDGNYLQSKVKFEPKYSMYFYKEINEDEDIEDKYLLLRLEIPGNIVKLFARSTDPKKEKYRGIIIKGFKEKDKFEEESKEDFKEIYDNRNYEEFSYFIELKRNLELSKKQAIGNTGLYQIKFDKRNKEKKPIRNSEANKENKEVEGEMIASGVYVMKFSLTENSFI